MIARGAALILIGFIYAPLVLLVLLVLPVIQIEAPLSLVQQLYFSSQFLPSLVASLISTAVSLAVALILAHIVIGGLLFSPGWRRLSSQLPYLLAFPHLVFAVGAFVLLAPKGWFERSLEPLGMAELFAAVPWVEDGWGVSLGVILGIKEAWFLCWILWSQIQRASMHEQYLSAQTLGYGRLQIIILILFPQLRSALRWPLVAMAAYSLSSVEMAWVLGPTNPPTLAVLGWQLLLDAEPQLRQQGLLDRKSVV